MFNYVDIPEFNQENKFQEGYEACWEKYHKMVEKLGKKYLKEFLKETKDKDNNFYTTFTTSTHPHKCNCKYCELK